MSLWGATVITNLLSAIPWIGQDFVQLVYTNTIYMITALPLIGTINLGSLAGQKARSSEQLQQFLTVPLSFLAQLAGLIDGFKTYILAVLINSHGLIKSLYLLGTNLNI